MSGWLKASSPKYPFGLCPRTTELTGRSAVSTRSNEMSAAETEAPTTTTRLERSVTPLEK